MNRRDFIKNSGWTAIGAALAAGVASQAQRISSGPTDVAPVAADVSGKIESTVARHDESVKGWGNSVQSKVTSHKLPQSPPSVDSMYWEYGKEVKRRTHLQGEPTVYVEKLDRHMATRYSLVILFGDELFRSDIHIGDHFFLHGDTMGMTADRIKRIVLDHWANEIAEHFHNKLIDCLMTV